METIKDTVERLARLAGKYAIDNVGGLKESFKSGDYRNIVTNIDIEISNFLKEEIATLFPDHAFYSEEETSVINTDVYTWVIDPVDGTSNYARRLPLYSACVTLMKGGEVVEAAVYAPVLDECFVLGGDQSFFDGAVMQSAETKILKNAYVNFHPGRRVEDRDWAGSMKRELLGKAKKSINLGSSSLDLCYVADGRVDILIYGSLTTIDIAGAIQMVRAAGGEVYNYHTKEPVQYSEEPQRIIATANTDIMESYFNEITSK